MTFLTREDIVALKDIQILELQVPSKISAWGGKSLYIRQLTRAQQDEYLKRQFGGLKMRQDRKAISQEITAPNMYGHDAWLCVQGICDNLGAPIFRADDEKILATKNGEAVGWIAAQIVKFSGMQDDIQQLGKEGASKVEDDIKN